MPDHPKFRVHCLCGRPHCPYRQRHRKDFAMARLSKDADTTRNDRRGTRRRLLAGFGNWKVTVALLLAMVLTQSFIPFGWIYWTLVTVYVVQLSFGYWAGNWWSRSRDDDERGPSWRRQDSRKADGDERGK